MYKDDFIKVPKALFRMGYFDNPNTMKIIMYLYYHVRFLPGYINGIYVDVGQTVISVNSFAKLTDMPTSTLRDVLKRLEKNGFLQMERVNGRFTKITITDYDRQPAPSTMLKGYV